ncbi:MAG: macro domain-containing protein [Selenomonas sp.]|jgi:O-acetyl-ADP-ribose deacetylase (regulator of RNase III)|nr:macro domain-containing protein [Selenomonas sp.]
MIHFVSGNLLADEAEALVNPVNCVGIMGKGLALQFKKKFPENFQVYHKACKSGAVTLGKMFIYENGDMFNPRYIVNFPTKNDWRNKSKLADIKAGLADLAEQIVSLQIHSVAIPSLGCGNGGLEWQKVRPLVYEYLDKLENVAVTVYEPVQKRPCINLARAMLLKLMQAYVKQGYPMTIHEVQKLAYLLQESGLQLNLNFTYGINGIWDKSLLLVLEQLKQGGYICIDSLDDVNAQIELNHHWRQDASKELLPKGTIDKPLRKAEQMITGYETPYGLSLLTKLIWREVSGYREDIAEISSASGESYPMYRALLHLNKVRQSV